MLTQVDSVIDEDFNGVDLDVIEDIDDFDLEEETTRPFISSGLHIPEPCLTSQEVVREHMMRFFSKKEMHCGGKICNKQLLSDRHIKIVTSTMLEGGVEFAYDLMENSCHFENHPKDPNGISPDVRLVINILNECSKSGIPKEFSTGMMLLYLKFCEGIMF